MEERIRERFTPEILGQALTAYGIDPALITPLDGFESFIYEFQDSAGPGILRISHSIRRTANMVRAELDWIDYLHRGGVGVSKPLRSINESWVEVLPDGEDGYYLTSAFEKARGNHIGPDWPKELLREYGHQIGLMHKLATTYKPSDPAWLRPNWNDPIHQEVEAFIPERDDKIRQIYWKTVQLISDLPVEKNAYGLIHQDAHRGNFYLDQAGKITFFDFDDSSYSWFVEDIALVLFYAVMGQDDPVGFTEDFLKEFLPGYFAAYPLDLKWFQEIPTFMKMRELDLYAVIHRSFDVENLDDPWCIWYLDGRKERLEAEIPYLDFDFSNLDLNKFKKD
jgi:Ser/Thr protein kinase RdoA (MazF antagonist)